MKNSSLKMKRVVGVILAFLMVFNLVVFTGQVGAFAGDTTSNDVGESTTNGSVTVTILTDFQEIKGIDKLEEYKESVTGTAKVAMIPEKYDTNDVIIGLPVGSAIVELNGLVSVSSVDHTSELVTDKSKIEHVTVPSTSRGKGFDTCPEGSIVYLTKDTTLTRRGDDTTMQGSYTLTEDAWFYNCCYGGVSNVGPFYIYSYKTEQIECSSDDVEVKFKGDFTPLMEAGTIDSSLLEAVIKVNDTTYTVPSIELSDSYVNPETGDVTITAMVGTIEKELTAAVKIEESSIFAKLKSGKYTGVQAKTFSKNDIEVGFTLDGESYTASDFELVDATVDPINGDTKITISYAGYTKQIEAATAITGDVKANGTTGVKELITKVSTITPKTNSVINKNSISTVEAAINIMEPTKLDKYVNEAIDLGDANVAVKQDGTAAKLQAKVNTVDASVITNSLTPEEIIRVLAGEKVDLRLEVVVDETTDAKETTGGQLIESNLNTNESAYYFTADLYKIFNEDEDGKTSITEFSDPISFTIDIPEEIRNEGRVFTLVASHELADGTFETFNLVDIDDDDATFTASTTKLCTMALVYADEVVAEAPIIEPEVVLNDGDVSPQTADLKNVLWTFIITVSAGAVLAVAFRKEFL